MRNLVPIKIKSGLHEFDDGKGHKAGHAKYPNLNLIDSGIRKNLDWSIYLDKHGIGLHGDKTCGHKEDGGVESPHGQQWLCTCVPADFANAAADMFPTEVSIISEVDFEDFYDNKAHAHESSERVDTDIIDAIKAKKDLGLPVPEETDAMNPDHPARGIRKNTNKTWTGFKAEAKVEIAA